MHNANMFFQQTSTARMIDHIVTSPNSLYRINHGSCPAQVSRHPEYHCFSEDCDLRNRISHSIVIKIHDLCYIYRPESNACKKAPRNSRQVVLLVSLHGSRNLNGTFYLRVRFTVFRLTFRAGYFSGKNSAVSPNANRK